MVAIPPGVMSEPTYGMPTVVSVNVAIPPAVMSEPDEPCRAVRGPGEVAIPPGVMSEHVDLPTLGRAPTVAIPPGVMSEQVALAAKRVRDL